MRHLCGASRSRAQAFSPRAAKPLAGEMSLSACAKETVGGLSRSLSEKDLLLFVRHRAAELRTQLLAFLDGRPRRHPLLPGFEIGKFIQLLKSHGRRHPPPAGDI